MQLEVVYIDDEVDVCEMFSEAFSSPKIHITTYMDPNQAIAGIAASTGRNARIAGTTGRGRTFAAGGPSGPFAAWGCTASA